MNKPDTATTMDKTNEHRPGYKWTKLGWVPEEWEVIYFGDAADLKNGLNYSADEVGTGVKIIGVGDFKDNMTIEYDDLQKINVEGRIPSEYFLKNDDLVFVRSNGNKALIGRALLIENLNEKISHSGFTIRARVQKQNLLPRYLIYFFNSELTDRQYHKYGSGTNISNLSQEILNRIQLPLPPLPEQKNIAAILSTWNEAIQALQELIAAKERQQKGLMQRLLTGAVRFGEFVKEDGKKDTTLGKVPKDWDLLKADEIFESVSIKKNGDEPLLAVTQENGVIPREMLEGRVMMPSGDTSSYKLVVPGNFVISLRSFQGGIEYSEYKGIVSPAYTVLNNKIPIVKPFFRHFFKSAEFIGRLSIAVIGIRDGKQISFKDFAAMKFRFPSLAEQERIATVLNEGEEEISTLNQKLDTLKAQKKGLMQRLLTGEVRTV